jgi:hypothetical protein
MNNNNLIKVGYCVAYDWHFLAHSLPLVYEHADKICLSIDKDRISWSGNPYSIDEEAFKNMISKLDHLNKISILEEDYHVTGWSPTQNEYYQRKRVIEHLGEDGWHIMIDCDEYFINFPQFVAYLKKIAKRREKKINVCCPMIHLYKQLHNGFLVVNPVHKSKIDCVPIASRGIAYETGRRNKGANIFTNFEILHQSWARTDGEIVDKISNWGHSHEVDKNTYLEKWRKVNSANFRLFENFHPLSPDYWPRLEFLSETSIEGILHNTDFSFMPRFSKRQLFYFNSSFFKITRKLRFW